MNDRELIKKMLADSGVSMRSLSLQLGRIETYIFNSLKNNKSITVKNLVRIGDILGYQVIVKKGEEEIIVTND